MGFVLILYLFYRNYRNLERKLVKGMYRWVGGRGTEENPEERGYHRTLTLERTEWDLIVVNV